MNKEKLFKVPLEVLNRELQKENGKLKVKIGQLESYVEEQKYDISTLKKRIKILTLNNDHVNMSLSKYKKSQIHQELVTQIKSLEEKCLKYKKEYEDIFNKYALLQNKVGIVTKLNDK